MTHYYEKHPFTVAQATHAVEVVDRLMKGHRFFLHRHNDRSFMDDPDYMLNPDVFADAIKLDESVKETYRKAKQIAEIHISETERKLGIKKPDLSGNKQVVQCSRYTGGFDICRVYPVTAFTDFVPQSLEALTAQQFKRMKGEKTEDGLSLRDIRSYSKKAERLASTIWSQLEAFDAHDPDNHRCLVMLESRIDTRNSSSLGDFADDRLLSLQDYPHAVGYLLQSYSMKTRIVRHNYVVGSTSRKSHVRFEHWNNDKPPAVCYGAIRGYSVPVMFATIL